MQDTFDFIAIGDTVTDAFIRIKDASVNCDISRDNCMICMRFADKIPYEDVWVVPAVGNSANASVSASRLGIKSALVTNLGKDYYGEECISVLKKEGVETKFITQHENKKTNYHYVLWYEDDRTILIKHEDYAYALPDIDEPKWIYFSSIAEGAFPFHDTVIDYLDARPGVKLAFQPGTFQIKNKDRILRVYRRADLFFCNKEESQRILGIKEDDIKKLLVAMRKFGPKVVVITDGVRGAYSYDGNEMLFMRAYPDPKPPLERTGAGDAFSSTFTVALALGQDIREALRWGPINSMSVVQQVGARAGLLGREELNNYLAQAPKDYSPITI